MEIAGQELLGIETVVLAVGMLCWVVALVRGSVHRWTKSPDRLAPWEISGSDFFLFLLLFVALFSLSPVAVARIFEQNLTDLGPRDLLLQGYGTQLSMLAAWSLFAVHPASAKPDNPGNSVRAAITGLITFIFLIPPFLAIFGGWYWILDLLGMEPTPQDVVETIQDAPKSDLVFWMVLTVVIAPITEEFVFRGTIFRFFAGRMPTIWASAVSGAFFSLVHYNMLTFVPLLVLGMVLSTVFMKTGRLSASIALHAAFNGFSMIVILLSIEG